jgi:hypothetical protein
MALPESAIIQFKKIWKNLYKIELDDKEARFRAENLVALYRAVYNKPSNGKNIIQSNNTEQPLQRF